MNANSRVFVLTVICFSIYFLVSLFSSFYPINMYAFEKVNLVHELFPINSKEKVLLVKKDSTLPKKIPRNIAVKDFNLYKNPNLITDFNVNSSPALPHVVKKLNQLKKGEEVKVRIAYFGDSMIEADLITQTLRALLQKEYGGRGVGFLPIDSKVSKYRQTAIINSSGWIDTSFKSKDAKNLYLSGHYFTGNGKSSFTDKTYYPTKDSVEKSLIFGKTSSKNLLVNQQNVVLNGAQDVNRIVIANDTTNSLVISNTNDAKLYGVSYETKKGVFVDNFSFRGITGVEYKKIDLEFLKSIQASNHYDLIVLQYGVNLMFRANDKDYSYYGVMIKPVLENFKSSFNDADILLLGSADRAFRYDGVYKTAIGLPNLVELQARLAFDYDLAFYNLFESMGGENSIVEWANAKPALANKDYIHPNHKGSQVIAEKLFQAIQNDYKKILN